MRVLFRSPIWLYRLGLGWLLRATPLLILATWGRASGQPRYAPLEYRRHGSKTYIISGFGKESDWYQNLLANPAVTVQNGAQTIPAHAETVTDHGEALRVLHLFRNSAPAVYDAVMAELIEAESLSPDMLPEVADRFLIVRLTSPPTAEAPPALKPDLAWVLPALAGGIALLVTLIVLRRRSLRTD